MVKTEAERLREAIHAAIMHLRAYNEDFALQALEAAISGSPTITPIGPEPGTVDVTEKMFPRRPPIGISGERSGPATLVLTPGMIDDLCGGVTDFDSPDDEDDDAD